MFLTELICVVCTWYIFTVESHSGTHISIDIVDYCGMVRDGKEWYREGWEHRFRFEVHVADGDELLLPCHFLAHRCCQMHNCTQLFCA